MSLYQRLATAFSGKRLFLTIGSAFSDGSTGRKEGERHAFLAYVYDKESETATRVFDALEERGWKLLQIDDCKLLNLPFENTNPILSQAFQTALDGDVGLVIYSND